MIIRFKVILILASVFFALTLSFPGFAHGQLVGCGDINGTCKVACGPAEANSGTKDCGVGKTCCVSTQPTTPPGGEGVPVKIDYCHAGGDDQGGIQTALGCIPYKNPTEFIGWFLKWAIGIAGGIAFLLILFSGFQIMTASGNPEKLQAGRELLTAAISGLILIIFSVFLLKLIGVEILQLPGLAK